ncbi:hypothetical protein [Catellatospora sp. NPDC049609]|uniref:hypothetical protein n=1 Tax=Catellatospora sp. NPDC049609 TaxID=3155505 RepID=UPI003415EF2D
MGDVPTDHAGRAAAQGHGLDRESEIGGTGRVSAPKASFAGTLATQIRLTPSRGSEFKGMVERTNGFLETSLMLGRLFT